MISLVLTHEPDEQRPGGWYVVRCPDAPLVSYGDGAIRRATRAGAIRGARLALLAREMLALHRGTTARPVLWRGTVVVDQTAGAVARGA